MRAWLWYLNLSPRASARFCGNCFLGSVGVATELSLVGLLLILVAVFGLPHKLWHLAPWLVVLTGIALTPYLLGVPLFAVSLPWLACAHLQQMTPSKAP